MPKVHKQLNILQYKDKLRYIEITSVETEEYFDKYCWQFWEILMVTFYIIYSYKIVLLIWFTDRNVESQRDLVGLS